MNDSEESVEAFGDRRKRHVHGRQEVPFLLQNFFDKRVEPHFHFMQRLRTTDAAYFCAIFQRSYCAETCLDVKSQLGRNHLSRRSARLDNVQHAVLVDVGEFLQDVKGVSANEHLVNIGLGRGCDAVVGLQTLDDCLSTWPDAKDLLKAAATRRLPLGIRVVIPGSVGEDRELISASGSFIVGNDELPDQMIQSRAEVIKAVTDQHAELDRGMAKVPDIYDVLSSVRIGLGDQSVRVRLTEADKLTLSGYQVLLRPVELGVDATQVSHSIPLEDDAPEAKRRGTDPRDTDRPHDPDPRS